MPSSERDTAAILAAQLGHQARLGRRRMTRWIPALFVVGLGVSILGLVPAIGLLREGGGAKPAIVLAAGAAFFGWAVATWLLAPARMRPRIVPYFARPLGEHGGTTMAAFVRGRALYRELVALDELAARLGVTPLSAFGFAYDHYEQEVAWHPAPEGLRTVEALRHGLGAPTLGAADVAEDLAALAVTLRAAADQRVEFSLVLRLHARDSMQAVMTREARRGSFWIVLGALAVSAVGS